MKRCWIHWAGDTLICRRQLGGYRIEIGLALLLWFSRSVVPNTLRPHGLQQPRFPGPSPSPGACSNSFYWISDAIQPSYPLSSLSPPSFNLSKIRVFSIRDWPAYSWSTSTSPGTRGKPPAQRPQRGSSEVQVIMGTPGPRSKSPVHTVGNSSWNESSWALFRGFIAEMPTWYWGADMVNAST